MDLLDPFSPTQTDPNAAPSAPANSGITQQWSDALNDPVVRTSLLQAGIALMQPPGFGQTGAGHIGRAIGSAGEALTAQDVLAQKQQEIDSKAALRESQATSAESRAKSASEMVGVKGAAVNAQLETATGRLKHAGEVLSLTKTLQGQRRKIEASNAYTAYLKTRGPLDTEPPLSQEEFYRTRGFGDILAGGAGGGGTSSTDDLQRAQNAIANGANPDAVKALYKQNTGQDYPY